VDDPSLRNTGFFIMDIWDIFVELQSWSTMKTLKKWFGDINSPTS
jgi:hypothetical protein